MTSHEIGDHFARAVSGIAFNDNDFFAGTSKWLRPHTLKQRGDGASFIINRNDNRYFHAYVERGVLDGVSLELVPTLRPWVTLDQKYLSIDCGVPACQDHLQL